MNTSLPYSPQKRPPDNTVAGRSCGVGKAKNRPLFSLGARLLLCASMVRPSSAIADVGTDHAYLPIWLVKNGLISKAVAADIRTGPLQSAMNNICRCRVSDKISTRLSDGLEKILPQEINDVIIAGMGGKTIIHIIENAVWLKNPDKHLILQPMTSVEDLRVFLAENGFSIKKEEAAEEDGHLYTTMLVIYDPKNITCGEFYPYIGNIIDKTEINRKYVLWQARRLGKRSRGLRLCGRTLEAVKIDEIIKKMKNF